MNKQELKQMYMPTKALVKCVACGIEGISTWVIEPGWKATCGSCGKIALDFVKEIPTTEEEKKTIIVEHEKLNSQANHVQTK